MKNRNNAGVRCAMGIALVGALFTTCEAGAVCYPPGTAPAGTPTYDAKYPIDDNKPGCPPVAKSLYAGVEVYAYVLTMDESPSPASVICSDFAGGNYCEAWPKGNTLTYHWWATGGVTLDYAPAPTDSSVILNCTGIATGMGRVTVFAPGTGASQNASSVAYCGNQ